MQNILIFFLLVNITLNFLHVSLHAIFIRFIELPVVIYSNKTLLSYKS